MKESISLNWLNNMAFEAEVNGHKLYLDASSENGGKNLGPRPKPLMLIALGGCTGMDVVSILGKMRVEFESLQIIVDGDLTEEHPKKFTKMKIIYRFKGKNLPVDKLEKAVELSKDRYCGVSASLKDVIDIEYEIDVID
jgi:putative redox protein